MRMRPGGARSLASVNLAAIERNCARLRAELELAASCAPW